MEFLFSEICSVWIFLFVQMVMVYFNTEDRAVFFYLVHYKFYSKAHMIKLQFNLSIQNTVFVIR